MATYPPQTYDDMVQAIKDTAENDDAEFAAAIPLFIAAAELRIYRETDLLNARVVNTSTIKAGSNFVNKTTDVIVRAATYIDTNNVRQPLRQKDDTFCNTYWPNRSLQGAPKYYANFGDTQLMVVPTSNGTYTIEMLCSVMPVGSSSDNQTTWLLTYAWDCVLYASMIEAYGFMKGEDKAIAPGGPGGGQGYWFLKYQEALNRLQFEEMRKRNDEFSSGSFDTPGRPQSSQPQAMPPLLADRK